MCGSKPDVDWNIKVFCAKCDDLLELIKALMPKSRERSLVITKLEDVCAQGRKAGSQNRKEG